MSADLDVLADDILLLGRDPRRLPDQLDGLNSGQFSYAERRRGPGGRLSIGEGTYDTHILVTGQLDESFLY